MKPKIIRGGMKAPIAGAWVTATNITVVNTSVVSGAGMSLNFDADSIPNFVDLVIEVEFTAIRDSGSSSIFVWAKVGKMQVATVAQGAASPAFYTGKSQVLGVSRDRRILIKPPVIHADDSSHSNLGFIVTVEANSDGVSGGTVSGIQARLIYTPL